MFFSHTSHKELLISCFVGHLENGSHFENVSWLIIDCEKVSHVSVSSYNSFLYQDFEYFEVI